jgi:uncharacterized protein YegJ (DUF2314 family)
MRTFWTNLYAIGILLAVAGLHAESKYEDQPFQPSQSQNQLLREYSQLSLQHLPDFIDKLQRHEAGSYYVITRLHQGNEYEQIFVKVNKYQDAYFFGTIASNPMGPIDFHAGDTIKVSEKQVFDWTIVSKDGEEEGNYLGKAADLLQVGAVSFIYSAEPRDGVLTDLKLVSVINPETRQDVTELVPDEVLNKVFDYAAEHFTGNKTDATSTRYTFFLATFPGWSIIESPSEKK